jgi:pSer/pThr/pTyr-binding forkhead associated (FHA) protein
MVVEQICTFCQTPYTKDDLYCGECGWILPHMMGNNETHAVSNQHSQKVDLAWGTGYFHTHAKLFLLIPEQDAVIAVPTHVPSVVIGRAKEAENEACVDLSPYKAQDMGVSRHHVRLTRISDGLQIVDLNSSNGTFLNRDRLVPQVPHMLRNRAVLQLGRMMLRVKFA